MMGQFKHDAYSKCHENLSQLLDGRSICRNETECIEIRLIKRHNLKIYYTWDD